MSADDEEFNPWSVPDAITDAAREPGSPELQTLGDRIMLGVSWLFVFFGMMLIGLFLTAALMSLGRTWFSAWNAVVASLMLFWLLLSLYVARLNVQSTLRMRRRSRMGTAPGPDRDTDSEPASSIG